MKLMVGSSSLLSKVVFLFSVALILLVDNKNVVNATLVTTTTTTIETETTSVEEYENSPPRQEGEGPQEYLSVPDYDMGQGPDFPQEYETTNGRHGGFRGSSNINSNYDNNKYNDEANKGGVFGSAANGFLQSESTLPNEDCIAKGNICVYGGTPCCAYSRCGLVYGGIKKCN